MGNRNQGMPQPQQVEDKPKKEEEVVKPQENVGPADPPVVRTDSLQSHSEVSIKDIKEGIAVEATAKGFYRNIRRNAGDRFKIKNLKEAGKWMRCIDPKAEQQRVAMIKAKRAGK